MGSPILAERGLCVHRGILHSHPDNTLSGFRGVLRYGPHMIEFDLRLTNDGVPVLIHNATVDATTNGRGNVRDFTLEEIRKLDAGGWKSREFTGVRIPTFTEVLNIMPHNIWLNVHLKKDEGERLGHVAADIIMQEGREHQAFLACGLEAANAAKKVSGKIQICNMEHQSGEIDYVKETIALESDFIQLFKPFKPEFKEFAVMLKRAGVRINYYGTDDPEELHKLFQAGIDFVLVNNFDITIQHVRDLGIRPWYSGRGRSSS